MMLLLYCSPVYLCSTQTGVLLMSVAPLQWLLASQVYATKEKLPNTIGRDEDVDECFNWVLDLWAD